MPHPDPARRGPAQVIDDGGSLVLMNSGASALHRFGDAKLDPKQLRLIVLSPLHSDHITGLADLLWAAVAACAGGR